MIPKSPLMYLTLPLALAFGLIWFRRKKVHCDSGGEETPTKDKSASITCDTTLDNPSTPNGKRHDFKHSVSVPIGKSTSGKQQASTLNNNESFDFKFGKSAPIDITPNKTSPSRNKNSDKQTVDAEELSKKIQEAELKALNSIEEHSFESVDLPDSVGCRRRFSFTIKSQEPAIVIKASNMADEKSPQSSFGDVPVTFSEDGKKSKTNARADKIEKPAVKANATKTEQKKKSEPKKEAKISTASAKFQTNDKQARNLPVSSPPLSLCSNKSHESGDSGKGSSPPNSEGGQPLSSFDFELGNNNIGCLVGRNGQVVQFVKEKSGASILIRRHPTSRKYKLCTIEGTQKQVDEALAILRAKLPPRVNIKRYEFVEDTSKQNVVPTSTIDSSLLQVYVRSNILEANQSVPFNGK